MYIYGHESISLSSAIFKAITPNTIITIDNSGLLVRAASIFQRIHAHGFNKKINPKIFRIFKIFLAFIKVLFAHFTSIMYTCQT